MGRVGINRATGTGKQVWTRPALQSVAIADGFVVASTSPHPYATPIYGGTDGTVMVLDAATGRTRWSLLARMPSARMAAHAGGLILVREAHIGAVPVLLDLATGAELGRMPFDTGNCAGDGTRLIACDVGVGMFEPRLFTVRSDERRIRIAGHPPPSGAETIDLVQDGRIYLSGQEVDRSGTRLTYLPDRYLDALSDKYAVVSPAATNGYEVYRVG